MITIDSQIWIYYFDPNAPENLNVQKWMKSILQNEIIVLSTIIPLEVSHNLYAIPKISRDDVEELILKWITQENIRMVEVDQHNMLIALELMKTNRNRGIGGRDCLILASMLTQDVQMLVTNDKNLLRIQSLQRMNPVFDPPLILNKGEKFKQ
ncbi:MAG: PIN domain-containing protein [Candidatus Lokiarchaeota archaeon]|nr:PIN domain-containing protein [Candidatus Lokiarchaeota archaeon]